MHGLNYVLGKGVAIQSSTEHLSEHQFGIFLKKVSLSCGVFLPPSSSRFPYEGSTLDPLGGGGLGGSQNPFLVHIVPRHK